MQLPLLAFASYFLRIHYSRGHDMTVQELQTQWPQLMSTVSQTEIDEVNDVAQTVYHRNARMMGQTQAPQTIPRYGEKEF
ncbi:hypothetical protein EV361DRAFT_905657 [Lentinula raphanica]|nr:hypothetical protein EV361DRAFT_905657 [Lentinula raphanica]